MAAPDGTSAHATAVDSAREVATLDGELGQLLVSGASSPASGRSEPASGSSSPAGGPAAAGAAARGGAAEGDLAAAFCGRHGLGREAREELLALMRSHAGAAAAAATPRRGAGPASPGCLPCAGGVLRSLGALCSPAQRRGEPAQGPEVRPGERRRREEVWEMQRLNILTGVWSSPFLPHDGPKRWRWVDAQYQKHPWIAGSLEDSSLAESPPTRPPSGWRPLGDRWELAEARGPCDGEGWQYSVDFYQGDQLWGGSSALLPCRRRLWRRDFAAAGGPEDTGADEGAQTVVDVLLPEFPLGPEASALLSDEWRGSLVEELMAASGCSELEVGPWLPDAEPADAGAAAEGPRCRSRKVCSRLQCPPSAFAPTSTRASVRVCVSVEPGTVEGVSSVRFSSCWEMHDVPYGGCFRVHDACSLEPAEGGVRFAKTVRVAFLAPTALRSMIEHSTIERARALGPSLVEIVRRRAAGGPSTRVVEVWEMQRRRTLFHDTWESPFLPHDGQLQLRWVGQDYERHPWTPDTLTLEESASSSAPPLAAPEGWAALGTGWTVAERPGEEPEGWQYAVDFYRAEDLWGSQPALCHCRRRLWRREFALQKPP